MAEEPTPPTPYEIIGGDAGVRRLVDRFYDIMDSSPEAATIRRLHAASLKASREKLYLYLTGWTGGPQTYIEKDGPPILCAWPLPFSHSSLQGGEWLRALDRSPKRHPLP